MELASTCTLCISALFDDDMDNHLEHATRSMPEDSGYPLGYWIRDNDDRKYELFHGACQSCQQTDLADLCEWCRHLRLQHLLFCYPQNGLQALVTIRRSVAAGKNCKLCLFFQNHVNSLTDVRVQVLYLKDRTNWPMLSLLHRENDDEDLVHDASFWTITPERQHFQITKVIDWNWVQSWLGSVHDDDGRSHHLFDPNLYRVITSSGNVELDLSSQNCRDVRVVDVVRKCVVLLPPNAHYVALSYVWGTSPDCAKDLQCSRSNVYALERPGSLTDANLPQTVSDAMVVCSHLGHSFLWVDRLCIIQNGSQSYMSVQLDQMAAIYGQAVVTIVATEGDGADHGLVGVSRPRFQHRTHNSSFSKEHGIVEEVPSLSRALEGKRWAERGWTFQEYVGSTKLLFFTEHGLYFLQRRHQDVEVCTEGAVTQSRHGRYHKPYTAQLIEEFTKRTLTYSEDVLRAIAGIMYAYHGTQTLYGLPLQDFESYVLWTPNEPLAVLRSSTDLHTFPTWSWSSAYGPINLQSPEPLVTPTGIVRSLAYWGEPYTDHLHTSSRSQWKPIEGRTSTWISDDEFTENEYVNFAVAAWWHGCIPANKHKSLDPIWSEDGKRNWLKQRWLDNAVYWHDAFDKVADLKVFEKIDIGQAATAGKLAVYAQAAAFTLDRQDLDSLTRHLLIRIPLNGKIVGAVSLDKQSTTGEARCLTGVVKFIALSVGDRELCDPIDEICKRNTGKMDDRAIGQFYGCTGCIHTSDYEAATHIVQCPRHEAFWEYRFTGELTPWDKERVYSNGSNGKTAFQALRNNLKDASLSDGYGSEEFGPGAAVKVHVMLVTPITVQGGNTKVYERLGIGQVHLKRWKEASPQFETIVLA